MMSRPAIGPTGLYDSSGHQRFVVVLTSVSRVTVSGGTRMRVSGVAMTVRMLRGDTSPSEMACTRPWPGDSPSTRPERLSTAMTSVSGVDQ
jgi:hypothetical protein